MLLLNKFDDKDQTKNIYNIISQFFINFKEYSNYDIVNFIELIKEVFAKNGYELTDLSILSQSGKILWEFTLLYR